MERRGRWHESVRGSRKVQGDGYIEQQDKSSQHLLRVGEHGSKHVIQGFRGTFAMPLYARHLLLLASRAGLSQDFSRCSSGIVADCEIGDPSTCKTGM